MYLHYLTGDRPHQWLQWLPWAEVSYNIAYQASIKTSPFHVVYDRNPPTLRAYTASEARLSTVHQQLLTHDEFLVEIRDWLEQAQQHYKMFYDRCHRELSFEEG
jgi:hypothetical protein